MDVCALNPIGVITHFDRAEAATFAVETGVERWILGINAVGTVGILTTVSTGENMRAVEKAFGAQPLRKNAARVVVIDFDQNRDIDRAKKRSDQRRPLLLSNGELILYKGNIANADWQ